MNFEPHADDVVSMSPNKSLLGLETVRVKQLAERMKQLLGGHSVADSWLGEGAECEFLRASDGGGWQKGKIRIRFEINPDVLEPELDPEQSDAVLSPTSEQSDQLNQ
jgi:hypothetical protein